MMHMGKRLSGKIWGFARQAEKIVFVGRKML